jgi:hypothetical protein
MGVYRPFGIEVRSVKEQTAATISCEKGLILFRFRPWEPGTRKYPDSPGWRFRGFFFVDERFRELRRIPYQYPSGIAEMFRITIDRYKPIEWRCIAFPAWPLLVGVGTINFVLWRRKVLAQVAAEHGRCPTCRYDLRGSVDSERCPECGTAIDDATRQRIRAMGQTPTAR